MDRVTGLRNTPAVNVMKEPPSRGVCRPEAARRAGCLADVVLVGALPHLSKCALAGWAGFPVAKLRDKKCDLILQLLFNDGHG